MLKQRAHIQEGLRRGVGVPVIGAVAFVALVLAVAEASRGPSLDQVAATTALPSVVDGVISGSFVAGAGFAAFVGYRRHADVVPWWVVSIGLFLTSQTASIVALSLAYAPPRNAVVLGLMLAVAVTGLVCIGGATLRLRRDTDVADESFAIGLGMGLTAGGYLLLHVPVTDPPTPAMLLLVGVLLATYLIAAAPVLFNRALPPPLAALLVATLLTVAAGLFVMVSGLDTTKWDLAVSVARAGTAAAWLAVAWEALGRSAAQDRRRIAEIDQSLSITRAHRERLHELRSTMAGLVNGSELLDSAEMPSEVRQRLWQGVRSELCRMQRLLSEGDQPATDLDLDEALKLILELQCLKGRRVELHGSGDLVRARYDALAEVINILIDNAATHGGSDESLVEVVRHDDTVDITVTDFGSGIPEDKRAEIFSWGHRGSDSPGEGIGLNVAKRLMTEDGGSLRLSDPPEGGASFVISLPAARRSSEHYETAEEARVASRHSG